VLCYHLVSENEESAARICSSVRQFLIYSTFVFVRPRFERPLTLIIPTVVECVRVSRIMAKMHYTGFPVAFLKQVGAPKVCCVSYVVSFPKFHYSDKLAAFPSTLKLRGNVSNGF